MNISRCELAGLIIIEPMVFKDDRGFFMETWNDNRYREAGIESSFVQDNLSFSRSGVLRGLHFQNPKSQGKLVAVLEGTVFDVALDLRISSPSYKKWWGTILSNENKHQLYIPQGFAHGFVVLSDTALLQYKCTDYYSPKDEITLRWDDPELAIPWPVKSPVVSDRDRRGLLLRDIPQDRLFE